ncbi:hypothetical protein [Paraburkholderia silvatlantica]|uniref:hypothetical protein n=1 Tax=Paraburkholderia silvatlantica TaxID=321895 RepID=UPI00105C3637|nr:hypothetical protein [Paraburkholderia silvatlantica]
MAHTGIEPCVKDRKASRAPRRAEKQADETRQQDGTIARANSEPANKQPDQHEQTETTLHTTDKIGTTQ